MCQIIEITARVLTKTCFATSPKMAKQVAESLMDAHVHKLTTQYNIKPDDIERSDIEPQSESQPNILTGYVNVISYADEPGGSPYEYDVYIIQN